MVCHAISAAYEIDADKRIIAVFVRVSFELQHTLPRGSAENHDDGGNDYDGGNGGDGDGEA